MNETVKEWEAKAQGDYRTAKRELNAPDQPNFDAVCFHCQQCIEKLMKALLILHGTIPPRTHDLVQLGQILSPLLPSCQMDARDLRFLTRAAVSFRYPGESADLEEASEAFDICTRLAKALGEHFNS